jgi:hypothetical protein
MDGGTFLDSVFTPLDNRLIIVYNTSNEQQVDTVQSALYYNPETSGFHKKNIRSDSIIEHAPFSEINPG